MGKAKQAAKAMARAAEINARAANGKRVEAQRKQENVTAKAANKERKERMKHAQAGGMVVISKLSREELDALNAKLVKIDQRQQANEKCQRQAMVFAGGIPLIQFNEGVRYAN